MPDDVEKTGSFWEHLDELRSCLIRIIIATVAAMVIAFCMKDWLFVVILAPAHGDFVTYRLMKAEPVGIQLINTGLTEQFMMHMKASFHVGLLAVMPYILYVLFGFIAPGLYERERHYAVRVVGSGYLMFIIGTLVNYLLIFPLTLRFLGTYQVSPDVQNMLTLESYMDTLVTMNLMLGIVFQLPVLCWLLAVTGMLRHEWMTRYRRHAIVAIVVVAAIITPTTDAFTLLVVSLPIWLLYEVSIWVVRVTGKKRN
ncbi:MAG: twin-arginine translocase subunit TatC [Prevotella sp.]|nr:twin-arginine translocase subunit TatC [Prevotella sp.]